MPRMVLVASAPAPLIATPTPRLPAAASDAAAVTEVILAFSIAVSEIPPDVVVTPWLALAIYAATLLSIWLVASDKPSETATDTSPLSAAASETAVAIDVICEEAWPAIKVASAITCALSAAVRT